MSTDTKILSAEEMEWSLRGWQTCTLTEHGAEKLRAHDLALRAALEKAEGDLEALGKVCGEAIVYGGLGHGESPGRVVSDHAVVHAVLAQATRAEKAEKERDEALARDKANTISLGVAWREIAEKDEALYNVRMGRGLGGESTAEQRHLEMVAATLMAAGIMQDQEGWQLSSNGLPKWEAQSFIAANARALIAACREQVGEKPQAFVALSRRELEQAMDDMCVRAEKAEPALAAAEAKGRKFRDENDALIVALGAAEARIARALERVTKPLCALCERGVALDPTGLAMHVPVLRHDMPCCSDDGVVTVQYTRCNADPSLLREQLAAAEARIAAALHVYATARGGNALAVMNNMAKALRGEP